MKDQRLTESLPVRECLPAIIDAVGESTPVVLKAPPGAGKTTGIPPALLADGIAGSGQTLLVQPRRLAARAAASRIARSMGVKLGQEVGYHVRFDKKTSKSTRLIAMTTGILLRRLQGDPLLEDVSCVLLDEFHERSLEIDLALGMLHRIRTTLRPELKLVVMSATLDPQPIVDFLGDAIPVTSEGRSYPVTLHHSKAVSRDYIDDQVVSILPQALDATDGHVLVFLPGVGEIRRTRSKIESMNLGHDFSIHDLYGDLPPKQQDAVLAESNQRKIVLATNVAETSITIPGVTCVIDSGQARVMQFDPQVGLPKLQLEPISQASAEQRAGRAGRTEPGVCFRTWPAASHRARKERDTPEIERCDFSDAMLTLAAWGEREVSEFPWLTLPPENAVTRARTTLQQLGAIDKNLGLTQLGTQMLTLPLHPRIARFMIQASELGIQSDAAIAAALLTERDPFRGGRTNPSKGRDCDVGDRVDWMKDFMGGDRSAAYNQAAAHQIKRVADQILRMLPESDHTDPTDHDQTSSSERLKRSLLAAYPDRVARRRTPGSDRGLMVGGRGVKLDRNSNTDSGELFLCIDVDSKGSEASVRAASAIQEDWLNPELIREVDEPFFHPSMKAVVARRRRYFQDLMLSESPIECQPGSIAGELLFKEARVNLDRILPTKDKEINGLLNRVRFLTETMPELELPRLDEDAMESVLKTLCQNNTSFDQLKAAPWLDHLRSRYDYGQFQMIEKHAPARMTVPSGNTVAVLYSDSQKPIIEVRIQELFGWKETPRVAGGRVPVQLHLLGPNRRPQQITEDLANFWKETYSHVRKELRGRYPKHHWPEDPTTAKATHNGLKPR